MIKISWDVEELVALIDIYRRNTSCPAKIDINSELQRRQKYVLFSVLDSFLLLRQ